jgi:uncharacterized protein YkwD
MDFSLVRAFALRVAVLALAGMPGAVDIRAETAPGPHTTPPGAESSADPGPPTTLATDPAWLAYVNAYRASAGVAPLAHEPAWSTGAALHARYTVKEDVLAHSENTTSPWYTAEGQAAAQNSNVMASSGATTLDETAIDRLMQGPFHAVGIIDPRLARTGFGSYREADGGYQMAAALDVLRGRNGSTSGIAWPILWPAQGRRVPIGTYSGGEYPNPLSGCPGYSVPSGLPLIAQFGTGASTPVVTASSLTRGGQSLEHCVFTEQTYVNSDSAAQSLGRSVLGSRDAVILVPRAPLVVGSVYTASITVGGVARVWSFTVGDFEDEGCAVGAEPAAITLDAAAATRTVLVTAASSCAWTATSDAGWVSITGGSSGTGDGSVSLQVQANTSTTARSATLTVGDRTITVTQNGQPSFVSDGDGLDDAWEQLVGLSPSHGTGDDGPAGDPDGDGATNLQEQAAGTHPRGFVTRYFAEGATISGMRTRLAILNPTTDAARALVRFLKADGSLERQYVTVPARTRVTIDVESVSAVGDAEFSTVVESDVTIVVDRTVRWNFGGAGSHAETGVAAPLATWYFAEGATHSGFDLFYLLQNPSPETTARVRVRYLRPQGPPLEKTYDVPPGARFNIWVDVEEFPDGAGYSRLLEASDVSAVVEVLDGPPIIVERAMYLSRPGQPFLAGHESAGVTLPQTRWFLAEGATGDYFDLFALVANPTATAATVRATYLLTNGTVYTKDYVVAPNSRFNIWVDGEEIPGHGRVLEDAAVSLDLESLNGVPIIVERAMWWPGPTAATWVETHGSAGATATGTLWALAEGELGGDELTETYVLVANTSAVAGEAVVTAIFENGTSSEIRIPLLPRSRTSIPVGAPIGSGGFGPAVQNRRFGVLVESVAVSGQPAAEIVVERAMYSSPGGQAWAAGTSALATKLR